MAKLEELLEKEGKIGFTLERNECKKFLKWAKANGFKWMNGEEIKETDDCFLHMVVNRNKTIANISGLCWSINKGHPACRLNFKDFLKEN